MSDLVERAAVLAALQSVSRTFDDAGLSDAVRAIVAATAAVGRVPEYQPPAPMRRGSLWTPDRIAVLREYALAGRSGATSAINMLPGRSVSAREVNRKRRQLGLPPNLSYKLPAVLAARHAARRKEQSA